MTVLCRSRSSRTETARHQHELGSHRDLQLEGSGATERRRNHVGVALRLDPSVDGEQGHGRANTRAAKRQSQCGPLDRGWLSKIAHTAGDDAGS